MFSKVQRQVLGQRYFFARASSLAHELVNQLEAELPRLMTYVLPNGLAEVLLSPVRAALLAGSDQAALTDAVKALATLRNTAYKCVQITDAIAAGKTANYILKPNDLRMYVTESITRDANSPLLPVNAEIAVDMLLASITESSKWLLVEDDSLIKCTTKIISSLRSVIDSTQPTRADLIGHSDDDAASSSSPKATSTEQIQAGADIAKLGLVAQGAFLLSILTRPEALIAFTKTGFAPGPASFGLRRAAFERYAGFFHAVCNLPFLADAACLEFTFSRLAEVVGPLPETPDFINAKKLYNDEVKDADAFNFISMFDRLLQRWFVDFDDSEILGIPYEYAAPATVAAIMGSNGSYTMPWGDLDEADEAMQASYPTRASIRRTLSGVNAISLSGENRQLLMNFPIGIQHKPFNLVSALEHVAAHTGQLRTLAIAAGAFNRLLMPAGVVSSLRASFDFMPMLPTPSRTWVPNPRLSTDGDFSDTGGSSAVSGVPQYTAEAIADLRDDRSGVVTNARIINRLLSVQCPRKAVVDHARRSQLTTAFTDVRLSYLPGAFAANVDVAFYRRTLMETRQAELLIGRIVGLSGTPLLDLLNSSISGTLLATAISCVGLLVRAGTGLIIGLGAPYGLSYESLLKGHTDESEAVHLGKGITFHPLKTVPTPSKHIGSVTDLRLVRHAHFVGDSRAAVPIEAYVTAEPLAHLALAPVTLDAWTPEVLFNRVHLFDNNSILIQTDRNPRIAKDDSRGGFLTRHQWPGLSLKADATYFVTKAITVDAPAAAPTTSIEDEFKKLQTTVIGVEREAVAERSVATDMIPRLSEAAEKALQPTATLTQDAKTDE